ncbi:O-antigen ligase family protein [Vibrio kasasachensis]
MDMSGYFRKCALLLLFPLLVIQLARGNNVKIASISATAGLTLALCFALYHLNSLGIFHWNGQRITSFWDIGRWGEILGYCVALLVPYIFEKKHKPSEKISLTFLLILCVLCLLLSGGRAPLVAIIISIGIYSIIRQPKFATACILILAFAVFFGRDTIVINAITDRASSIFNTSNNYSNIARLVMWEYCIKFMIYNAQHDLVSFLFGSGISELHINYGNYIKNTSDMASLLKQTNGYFSLTDMHNTYLDLFAKLGFIYFITFISTLFILFKSFYDYRLAHPSSAYAGMCLILTFSVTGMFYTSGLEFQLTIFLALIALCYAQIIKDSASNE